MKMERESGEAIRVIAAVIRRDDRYLVCQRPQHKRHGGLWEFPGGKILKGESHHAAADRELAEELQVRAVGIEARLYTAADPGSRYMIEFVAVQISGMPVPVEHAQIRWCTLAEIACLPLAPADGAFVRACLTP